MDENGDPICIKISFVKDRSITNMMFRMIYKLGRVFFVSIYFYFYPAMAVWCTFQIPLYFRAKEKSSYVTMTNSFWVPDVEMTPEDFTRLNMTRSDYSQYQAAFYKAAIDNYHTGEPMNMGEIASDVRLDKANNLDSTDMGAMKDKI